MTVIVAGSRSITNYRLACDVVERSGFSITKVISGTAPGVDQLGERWGAEHRVPVMRMPADWQRHGRAAGPIRNRAMAAVAKALIALWDGSSHGTLDMIRAALEKQLRVYVHVAKEAP